MKCDLFSAEGLKWISEDFKMCQPFTKKEQIKDLKDFLADVWVNMAMMNYPYPTSFLKPLPGYPVKVRNRLMLWLLKYCIEINPIYDVKYMDNKLSRRHERAKVGINYLHLFARR